MAQRLRSRATRAFPKTLTGILASVGLAVLAALGIKTDWFEKSPPASTAPTQTSTNHPPGSTTAPAPAPGSLPHTPGSFAGWNRLKA